MISVFLVVMLCILLHIMLPASSGFQVRRNEWKCRQHVLPSLWCLSTKPLVCDITFQKTVIFIVIYVQWISGSPPLNTKINWKNESDYSVPFIFQFWSIIKTFIKQLKISHIWNTIKERSENFFGNSIWNIIIEILIAMKEMSIDHNIKFGLHFFLYVSVGMNWSYMYVVVLLYVCKTCHAVLDIRVVYIHSDTFKVHIKCLFLRQCTQKYY